MRVAVIALEAACVFAGGASLSRAAGTYAPLDQPGPPLTVPRAQLNASLSCEPTVAHAKVEPVLLNPGTGLTPSQNYGWNWEPALEQLGIPWCAYTAPNDTLNNIETSGEYLVHAIRTMYALAGRRIALMGHSQGGMSMRWPLRFWPDARHMVQDAIGFSGSNHGSTVITPTECAVGCTPAVWQQLSTSNFIAAINSDAETFPGISYTEIYTNDDEVVQPNRGATASAALYTGGGAITNVAVQQICSADVSEHLLIGTTDSVAYALAVDALTHPGPAQLTRISKSVCSQAYMPGVDPASAQLELSAIAGAPGLLSVFPPGSAGATALTGAPVVTAEPPLDCYVFASCTGADAPTLHLSDGARKGPHGRGVIIHANVRTLEGGVQEPVPGVQINVAGRAAITNRNGNARLYLRPSQRWRYRVTATRAGCHSAHSTVQVPSGSVRDRDRPARTRGHDSSG
jgi:hypothetical protein